MCRHLVRSKVNVQYFPATLDNGWTVCGTINMPGDKLKRWKSVNITQWITFHYLQFGYLRPNFMVVLLKDIAIIKAALRTPSPSYYLDGLPIWSFLNWIETVFGNSVWREGEEGRASFYSILISSEICGVFGLYYLLLNNIWMLKYVCQECWTLKIPFCLSVKC